MKCPECGSHECPEFNAEIAEADAVIASADAEDDCARLAGRAADTDTIAKVIAAHTLRYQERGYDKHWNVQYNVSCVTCGPVDEDTSESRHRAEAVTDYLKGNPL